MLVLIIHERLSSRWKTGCIWKNLEPALHENGSYDFSQKKYKTSNTDECLRKWPCWNKQVLTKLSYRQSIHFFFPSTKRKHFIRKNESCIKQTRYDAKRTLLLWVIKISPYSPPIAIPSGTQKLYGLNNIKWL